MDVASPAVVRLMPFEVGIPVDVHLYMNALLFNLEVYTDLVRRIDTTKFT